MAIVSNDITDLVGNTPLFKLNHIVPEGAADVYLKLESFNIGGSIKTRTALNLIRDAEDKGRLKAGDTIVEASTGNTGVGLALIGPARGYQVLILMPDNADPARVEILKAYGAQVEFLDHEGGVNELVAAGEAYDQEEGYVFMRQFSNPANPETHFKTTGPEIYEALDQVPDAFVAGAGTGGTLTGTARYLRTKSKEVEIYAVEPAESAVLHGKEKGPHKIQGIGPGIIPDTLDTEIYNEVLDVSSAAAIDMTRRLGREESIFAGISSGANTVAAIEVAKKLGPGKIVVAIAPDTGERYLNSDIFMDRASYQPVRD
ncbi:cysteine synthase A [Aerococcus sanguinicola]|uniref:cysteine synthase n=1 Tax=Aerococcus sanguinicola TaxID=119206 RepID=A0A2I1MQ72_9LACT|nr:MULTISPECIES: cysteine synthase A [Aerococcus]MDK7050114.1 cysteine synthase A [Aerococcus sanguinicola]OFT93313.1 cysteine synthase A [Aerococcus sp. HMSC23C02]PKZ22283.1 cysteine synthase A [Aerococcus sanguinicola]